MVLGYGGKRQVDNIAGKQKNDSDNSEDFNLSAVSIDVAIVVGNVITDGCPDVIEHCHF
ncbi:hypothetical protein IKT18_03095 [Candidatus Saccharibacteria bacterium]|nr:hypothetical protein [Candidatus Saccharibacteria bacterium]